MDLPLGLLFMRYSARPPLLAIDAWPGLEVALICQCCPNNWGYRDSLVVGVQVVFLFDEL
jgi:hypothetical protein